MMKMPWKTFAAGSMLALCSVGLWPDSSFAQRGGGRGGGGGGGGIGIGGGGGGIGIGGGGGGGGGGGVGIGGGGGGVGIGGGGGGNVQGGFRGPGVGAGVGGGTGVGGQFRGGVRGPGVNVPGAGVNVPGAGVNVPGARIQGPNVRGNVGVGAGANLRGTNRIGAPGVGLGVGARAGINTRVLGGNTFLYGGRNFALAGARFNAGFGRYPWYRGYWNGPFGWGAGYRYGWRPFGWGLGAWGLGGLLYNSGYLGYYNPYYDGYGTGWAGGYNYAQPIQVGYDDSNAGGNACQEAMGAATEAFRNNDFDNALNIVNRSGQQCGQDPVMHEFRALVLFAKGDYHNAAAALNALLAVGPGWDWATMSSLYSNVEVYTSQLRALEGFQRSHPDDAAAAFVLGYHYMSTAHYDAARKQFDKVVKLMPNDRVAGEIVKMLSQGQGANATGGSPMASVTPPSDPVTTAPSQPVTPPVATNPPTTDPAATTPATNAPAIDAKLLVGQWSAQREDGSTFDLALNANGTFQWQFAQKGQKVTTFTGKYTVNKNVLALERKEGGALIGEVTQGQDGRFNFRMVGAPAEDKGLDFGQSQQQPQQALPPAPPQQPQGALPPATP